MKKIIVLIYAVLFLFCFQILQGQTINQIWSHKVFDYTITFNFEKQLKSIDTLKTYEGNIYYFRLLSDSCYFRFNYLTPEARFGCCEDSEYVEINRSCKNGITDRTGKIKNSKLFWRKIQNKDIEVIYDYCPEEKVKSCNKVMDSILVSLSKGKLCEKDKKLDKQKK